MSIPNFYRGDTKKYRLVIQDKTTAVPISVAGATLTVSMKKKQKDTTYLLQEVVSVTDTNPVTGVIEVTLPAAKTELLPAGNIYYDFELVSSTGEVTTILAGTVEILYDITVAV